VNQATSIHSLETSRTDLDPSARIRRVKCDEQKPYCNRCTSTGDPLRIFCQCVDNILADSTVPGRRCDGYDKATPSRNRSQDSIRGVELAKLEFLKEYQGNEAVRSMRPIMPDIDGNELEKRLFHRCREMAAEEITARVCSFTTFWAQAAPQTTHHETAVKHAIIAVGAACQLRRYPDEPMPEGLDLESLEMFTIQQYNKSISELQRHIGSSSIESIKITLLCCLGYICLEILREDHQAAVTHLSNGLKILESLPDASFDFLAKPHSCKPDSQPNIEMSHIIWLFGKLEVSPMFCGPKLRPTISLSSYQHRLFDDGAEERPFADVYDSHNALCTFLRDAVAHLWLTESQAGERGAIWTDPIEQQRHTCLRERAARLESLGQDFIQGPRAPKPNTREFFAFQGDLLQFRRAQNILMSIDDRIANPGTFSKSGDDGSLSTCRDMDVDSTASSSIHDDNEANWLNISDIYEQSLVPSREEMCREMIRLVSIIYSSQTNKWKLPVPDLTTHGLRSWIIDFERASLFGIFPRPK
jgi:hypothetical protein